MTSEDQLYACWQFESVSSYNPMCNCGRGARSARPAAESAAIAAYLTRRATPVATTPAASVAQASVATRTLQASGTATSPAWRVPTPPPVTTIGATAVTQAATAMNTAHRHMDVSSQGPRQAGQVAAISRPVTVVNSPSANTPRLSLAQMAMFSRFPGLLARR